MHWIEGVEFVPFTSFSIVPYYTFTFGLEASRAGSPRRGHCGQGLLNWEMGEKRERTWGGNRATGAGAGAGLERRRNGAGEALPSCFNHCLFALRTNAAGHNCHLLGKSTIFPSEIGFPESQCSMLMPRWVPMFLHLGIDRRAREACSPLRSGKRRRERRSFKKS